MAHFADCARTNTHRERDRERERQRAREREREKERERERERERGGGGGGGGESGPFNLLIVTISCSSNPRRDPKVYNSKELKPSTR